VGFAALQTTFFRSCASSLTVSLSPIIFYSSELICSPRQVDFNQVLNTAASGPLILDVCSQTWQGDHTWSAAQEEDTATVLFNRRL